MEWLLLYIVSLNDLQHFFEHHNDIDGVAMAEAPCVRIWTLDLQGFFNSKHSLLTKLSYQTNLLCRLLHFSFLSPVSNAFIKS